MLCSTTCYALRPRDKEYRQLEQTKKYALDNGLKTKLMLFNFARNYDFLPSFLVNMEEIELLEETKLLGLVIRRYMSQ